MPTLLFNVGLLTLIKMDSFFLAKLVLLNTQGLNLKGRSIIIAPNLIHLILIFNYILTISLIIHFPISPSPQGSHFSHLLAGSGHVQ